MAGPSREKKLSELCGALAKLHPPIGGALAHQLVLSLKKILSPDDLFDSLLALEVFSPLQPSIPLAPSAPSALPNLSPLPTRWSLGSGSPMQLWLGFSPLARSKHPTEHG